MGSFSEYMEAERACTVKQRLFVQHYCKHGRGGPAVEFAGYTTTNYPRMAWNLLNDPKIKRYIELYSEAIKAEAMVTVTMLVGELKNVIDINPFDTLEAREDPKTKKITFWTKDLAELKKLGKYIKKYKIHRTTGEIEVEFYDKMDAFEKLMKYAGGYEKDNDQKKTDQVQIYLPSNGRDIPATEK